MSCKVIYVVSDIEKALAFEWIAKGLKDEVNLSFVLLGKKNSSLSIFLKNLGIPVFEINGDQHGSRLSQWFRLLFILWHKKPDVIHTHLWNANLLGLSTAWLLRIKKRIYTRHHATTHYREFPSGRKWDLLCNALATHIVAISENIKEILLHWDGANKMKVQVIPHGFDFAYFQSIPTSRIESLRTRYQLTHEAHPVVGVISRYMEWKGIQFIIPAFQKFREAYPNAVLVLANAHGSYHSEIKKLLLDLPPGSYREIKFEEDLAALYKLFDVFVHVPIDQNAEAFGQTYVEALISGVPAIFTLSGIAREFISDKQNALVVDFKNTTQITEGLKTILSNVPLKDNLVEEGLISIQRFSLESYILALKKLYTS